MRQRKAFSRGERMTQVITAIAIDIQKGLPNQLTAYDLARKLDITPSTKFYEILREMVACGHLDTFTRPNSGKWTTWYFALPEGSYNPPRRKPQIKIYNRGKLVNQLELFS